MSEPTSRTPGGEAADELKRQRRLVDQMATMQSALRDRSTTQAQALRVSQLVLSVVATAFAFAGSAVDLTLLGVTAQRTTWLGWLAVAILCLAVVDLVFDRSGEAGKRDSAVRQLASLKSGYRVDPNSDEIEEHLDDMTQRYETTMDAVPPVPERDFLRLKARHLTKVEVSRYLSEHPGATARAAARQVRRRAARATD